MFQRTVKLFILAIASAVVSIILANPAHAGTITVTIGFDRFDASASSDCSLREAIQTANTNTPFGSCQVAGALGDDVIVFDPGLTTVTISRTVTDGNNNDNNDGDLDAYVGSVSGTLTIQGPITIEVDNSVLLDRAFDVHVDSSASGAFTLTQVVVRGGRLTFSTIEDAPSGQDQLTCRYGGGGLRVRGGVTALLEGARVEDNIAVFSGGGICAREGATLALTGTTVVSNAVGLNGNAIASFAAGGGGLWSMGNTWLINTFVITNRAVLSGGFFGLAGGGGVGVLTASLTLVDSTVRGNVAEQNADAEANGGGLMVARWSGGPSLVRIENSYIEDNQSLNGLVSYGGGAAFIQGVRVEMRNSIVARNVLSAAEAALGGGGAFGLSYQPTGYQPPTIDLDTVTFRNNTATVSIPSVAGQITPTVFGGGAFFGVNTTFTVTAGIVQSNTIRYTGTSITNTNGFGGGLGTLNHTSGLISGTDVLSNTAENFRFIGGAGMQTQGNLSRVINSRASGNYGVSSPATDFGGVFGGGYYVADWGAAHITGSRFEGNVITRTSAISSFTSGGGVGVDGKAFITHTVVQSNTATQGGGMGIGGGGVVVARWVTVTHNVARHHDSAEGGGVTGAGDVEMRDSLIAHNVVTAPNYAAGGGVSRYGGVLRLVNVEIRQNEAQAQSKAMGGGGSFSGGSAHLTQTQVLSNVARSASNGAFNGGLNNLATLRVVTSTIAHNRAVGDSSSGSGGLGNTVSASAEVIDSLIANNRVTLPDGNPTGSGGGIVNGDSGTLTVRRSSIVGNQANDAAAINTYGNPTTRIVNSTVSGNSTTGGAPNVILTGTAYLTHTTIASNTGGGLGYPGVNVNAYGVLIAYHTYNCTTWTNSVLTAVASLSSDGGCPSGFIANADPLLEPLALNGGATPNHALKPGSPALEGVAICGANEDQRGVSRPQGQACDIGAFELEATNLAVSKSVTPANPQTGDVLTYTIIVTNLSTFDAELVTLTDTISGNVVFGGVVSAGGGFTLASSTTNQAVFTNSVLSAGASATIVFTATATQGGLVTNTVTVRSGRPDSNLNDNTVQVPSAVQAIADLALAKAAAGSTAVAGQPFTYTLTITNNGPDTANQVVITDALSGGAVFSAVVASTEPASLISSLVGAQAAFTVTNIAPSSVFTIVYTVLPPVNGGVFSNTAVISSSTPTDPNPGNDIAGGGGGPVTAAANADLAVAKSAAPTLVEPGGVVTYTLTVTNNGPSNAQFITVTDVLSGGSFGGVVTTSTGASVTMSGNSVTFTVGSLNANSVITMVYTATAPSLGVMTNTAVVTSAVGDFGSDSNQAGVTVAVNATDLALAKSAAGGTAVAGQPFTYTLTITNNGPLTATQVVITDALSGGATFNSVVDSTSLTYSLAITQATFTVTNIAPNTVFTIVYTVLPPVNGGTFANTAVISASTPTDPNPGNDTAGGPVDGLANADLEIAKSASPNPVEPGGVVTYTLTVTNNGPSNAQFITVTDVISGGSFGGVVGTSPGVNTSISANSITFTVGSLNANSVITMVYTATAPSLGVMTNTAVVTSAVGDLGGGDNQAGVTVLVNATDLALSKAAAGSTAVAGQPFTYTLTITNNGPLSATQVVITDDLSGGATFNSIVASTNPASLTHSFLGAQATFTVTNIAPSGVFTIVYTVLPPVNGGTFANTAVISASTPTDPNPGNDTAGGGPVNGLANADLTITKAAASNVVEPGGVVTFTLTVTNNGPSTAQFITVTDVLSGGSFGGVVGTSPGVNTSISANSITFTVGSLNANSVITMVYTATAPSLGVMTNTAVVTSAVGDLGGGDNQAGVTVQVQASTTTLTITKQQTYTLGVGSTIRHYGLVTYTITVTNTGTATATNVIITDALSSALSFLSASGGCAHSGGVVTCTLGDLSVGQSVSVQIVAQATGTPGSLVNNVAQAGASNAPQVSSAPVSARIEYKAFMPIVRKPAMVYLPIARSP